MRHARMPRGWKAAGIFVGAVVVALGITEAFLRFGLGLGDPPLYVRDTAIDYALKPNATYDRFGSRYSVNSYGMRARDPAVPKPACELRVLAVGDSVLNGGARLDQAKIATALLEKRLAEALKRPVWVGNLATGGWAPENEAAHLQKHGWHGADVAVFVLSTHDVHQRTSRQDDIGPNFPLERPWFALSEAVMRYLLPRLPFQRTPIVEESALMEVQGADPREAEAILREMIVTAAAARPVIVVHHRERNEGTAPTPEKRASAEKLREIAVGAGATYIDDGTAMGDGAAGQSPYIDNIHLNAVGQAILADVLFQGVAEELARIAAQRGDGCELRAQAG